MGATSVRLFITGATGFIGQHLVARAVSERMMPTVLVRDTARLNPFSGVCPVVKGDMNDFDALRLGARSADVAIHLASVTRTSDPARSQQVNIEGTEALIAACRAERVRRIVALSTLSVHNAVVGPYGRTKREMEKLLLGCGLEVVILRPSLVYGPGEAGLFHRMTQSIERLPVVPIIGTGKQRVRPVHVSDVVEVILQCVRASHVIGRCYDIVGPEEVRFCEFVAQVSRIFGQRKRQVHIPAPVARFAAHAMARIFKEPPITLDNVIGATQVTVNNPSPAWRDFSIRPTSLRDGLATIRDPVPRLGNGTERPLRIAIVGLGKMGLTHTALFSMIPGVRVAALVDQRPQLAATVRGMGFHTPFFLSLADAITHTRPDGVVIATPTDTHAPLARLAAEHGVGILVEKPLAENLPSALTVANSIKQAGVQAACGYTLAYLPTFERIKVLLDDGVLGQVYRFESSMFLSDVLGPKSGWHYEAARAGGGVLPNVTSHLLFLLHWFFGSVEEVEAKTESLFTAVDDAARIRLKFASGVTGTVDTCWSVEGYPLSKTEITIEGDNGRLVVNNDWISLNLRSAACGLAEGETRIHTADLTQDAVFDLGGEGYCKEDADFLHALRTRQATRVSLDRALHVQRVLEAIYRSAASGGGSAPLQSMSLQIQEPKAQWAT
jgi:predicted dehydrogenase/nucleoside-diphosphate-sugar epimerase